MRARNLRPALFVALAALLLAAGLAPASPSEAADETVEVETITTVLQPGWNAVGWVGPETPTSDLFEMLPQLRRVSAWDAREGAYRRAFRGDYARLVSLTPGMGLWLHLGGDATVEWTRSVSGEAVLLSLQTGWNLVGWTGDDRTGIDEAVARFGDMFVYGAVWNASTQRYAHYRPRSGNTEPPALSRGDAVWVDLTSETRWWQSGTAQAEFVFSDGVSPEQRSEIRKGMEDIITSFAERFGAYAPELKVSVSDTEPGCWARPGFLKLVESFLACPVHEYFHVLQFTLAEGRPRGPEWLVEGSATYAEEAYEEGGLEFRRWIAPASASHVASIRNPGDAHPSRLNYHLGFLAADWLVEHAGEPSLLDYYRLLPSSGSWEEAFGSAFGLTTDEFYDAFEAYRAEVAPPLPHLTDADVRPIATFLGDVPEQTRNEIQTEMDAVHTFLSERFGAESSEYSVYVGSDWDAVTDHAQRLARNRWWDDRVRRLSLPLEWDYGCSIGVTGWIIHSLSCGQSLDHKSYANSHIRILLQGKHQLDPQPLWIEAGSGIYIDLAYRSAYGDEISWYTSMAARSTVPLAQLEAKEDWAASDGEEKWALSVLALDWLLRHAGESALFEYFRLLPPNTSVHPESDEGAAAAFEQAFGLTIEDFYEQFEAYRATLQ